ncbi:Tubulin/FtsZ family, GTPase domain-containing protein [Cladochytrium replicatum]|nr:Tubulin/FtsZ family, GTPase domain-containing protein [Cladochytrium replicatum]
MGELFDDNQIVMGNSGRGNNWSVAGYSIYGRQYQDDIIEAVRTKDEYCDALGSFFVIKSMGGGTGSHTCAKHWQTHFLRSSICSSCQSQRRRSCCDITIQ